jgi:hypothetical protein
LDTSAVIIDDIVVVSIKIGSRAIHSWRVHTSRCDTIAIVARIGIARGVAIAAADLACCCAADYVVIVAADITDTFSVFDCLP